MSNKSLTSPSAQTKKKSKAMKYFVRVLLGILGFLVGAALYFVWIFGGTYVGVPIVSEDEYETMVLSADGSTTGGDVTSPWSEGGHTRLYYDPAHPIIKVDQIDPDIENILVFGVDSRGTDDYKCRTDAMIIVSINKKAGTVKLISLMRDTGVYIGDTDETASDKLDKLNAAYAYGGVGLMINTINRNFGLDIQRFVMLDFGSSAELIDLVGGVEIDVAPEEVKYANPYIQEINALNGTDSPLLNTSGLQTLDGTQATGWARIRYLDSDFVRTSRQRTIAMAMMMKVKNMSYVSQLMLLNDSAGVFETNMVSLDLMRVATNALAGLDNVQEYRVPADGLYTVQNNPWMMIIDFASQKQLLYDFIYGDT